VRRVAALSGAAVALLAVPATASADGAGTPQAIAARAEFLSSTPAPPGGAGAVCVIDSGVDTDTDLGPALTERGSVLGPPFDDLGATSDTGVPLSKHGTYVAGVIASQVDGVGASGIWPASKVVSVRAFSGGRASAWDYIQAINWCQQPALHTKVINLSLAGLSMTVAERNQLHNKITQTRDQAGINVVAAAGNSGLDNVASPAAFAPVFSVAATDAFGNLAHFSNRGPELDIATFGTDVCVTTASGHHLGIATGTSYAAPIVSATLNALRSYEPSLTPDQAEQALIASARIVNGVRVLDVARTFIDQGLGTLVAAGANPQSAPCEVILSGGDSNGAAGGTRPPKAEDDPPPNPEVVAVPAPAVDAPLISVALPDDAAPKLAPERPTLRRLTFRGGRLQVVIDGRRAGDVVTFMVDGRRYVRRSSRLGIRTRSWRTVRVSIRRPGAGPSPTLVIRRSREFS